MKRVEKIKSYYEKNMDKGLPDHSILGWESKETQALRFDALVTNIDLNGMKILDVGCGTGNLVEHLTNKGIKTDYTGIDILQSMIDMANRKNLKAKFLNLDIFKTNPFGNDAFDLVYSSGIFNLNLDNNIEFLTKALVAFLGLSRKVVAFNLLNDSSLDKEDKYYYYKPAEIRKLIEDRFVEEIKSVTIIEGYLHNDFTVICEKI
jgi:SAM-dependent methyltransferase